MFSEALIVHSGEQAMRHVALLTLLTLATPDLGFSQLYNVVPRAVGDAYAISEGGTIRVSGGSITEWSISVVGDVPYTFSHTNPNAMVFTERIVNITPTAITVDFDQEAVGGLTFSALDGSDAECPGGFSCEQSLSWQDIFVPDIVPPQSTLDYVYIGFNSEGRGTTFAEARRELPTGEFLVATVVPEPSAFTLGWVAGLCVLAARQRQTH